MEAVFVTKYGSGFIARETRDLSGIIARAELLHGHRCNVRIALALVAHEEHDDNKRDSCQNSRCHERQMIALVKLHGGISIRRDGRTERRDGHDERRHERSRDLVQGVRYCIGMLDDAVVERIDGPSCVHRRGEELDAQRNHCVDGTDDQQIGVHIEEQEAERTHEEDGTPGTTHLRTPQRSNRRPAK